MRSLVWVVIPLFVLSAIAVVARAAPRDCDPITLKTTGQCR